MHKSIQERFFSKVEKTQGCWLWTASISKIGYGQFGMNGKSNLAHRVSYFLKYGEFPDLNILHSCDNRRCVNPDHLFVGTQIDNMRDASAKRRLWQFSVRNCPAGHAYPEVNPGTRRECKECRRKQALEYYYRNHEKRKADMKARYHGRKAA